MSNHLTIEVTDPNGLLATQPTGLGAGALIRIQRSATQTGTYADVVTLTILANVHEYQYEHLAGLTTDWYKVRFEDLAGSYPKDYGAPFQVADPTTAYADPAAFRTFMRTSGIDVDAYTEKLALETAARAIDRYCGRQFRLATALTARTYTVGKAAAPKTWPFPYRFAVDVDDFMDTTGLAVNFDATGNGSYTTACTTFRPMPTNAPQKGMPYTSLLFDFGTVPPYTAFQPEGIQVTAKWGWSAIPSAISYANMLQASRFAKRRDAPFGVAGSDEMGGAIRLLPKLDADLVVALAQYRLDWGNQ